MNDRNSGEMPQPIAIVATRTIDASPILPDGTAVIADPHAAAIVVTGIVGHPPLSKGRSNESGVMYSLYPGILSDFDPGHPDWDSDKLLLRESPPAKR